MVKKLIAPALSLLMCLSLIGCAPAAPAPADGAAETAEAPADHSGSWTFTDSLGRTVTFEGALTRVAPSGKLAQQCIYAIAPEVIIGLSSEPSKAEARYFPQEFTELPVLGTFYGKKANFNRESVLAAGPQVIIDMGEAKDNMQEDLDALQDQMGIPVIFIQTTLEDSASSFTALGQLLEKPGEAKALADYCAATVADAKEKTASIPKGQRKTLYYAMQDSGLTTAAKGDFHTEVIDLVGAENVVASDLGHSFFDIDMERLLDWDPDVIVFAPGSIYSTVGEDARWKELKAVASGACYEVPAGPYNWLDQPPAANRYIGIKWLGNLLYPDIFGYDMIEETINFYNLFYHVDLAPEDAQALMANSTFRK